LNNKLILGTVQFGLDYGVNNTLGKPSQKNIAKILDYAFQNGISILDTAEAYGDSQTNIGVYHNSSSNVFKIISKFSPLRSDLSKEIKVRVTQNLNILNVQKLHGYMFHSFQDFEKYYPSMKRDFGDLQKNGLIEKIGVSLHENKDIETIFNYSDIKLIQLPFNLFDNSNHRKQILEKAKQRGIEVHSRSAFLQGLFFKKENTLTGNLKKLQKYLKCVNNLTSSEIQTNDLALNYALKQPYIDQVLIGVDNIDQLKGNLKSLKKYISMDVIKSIESIQVEERELLNPANWKT
tara:strand:+ start:6000 stop:6875 length:876 start_codon:yes stop_codon:yes gene_type:complete